MSLFPLHDDPEALAKQFHYFYENLAPHYGYETREDSAKPWDDVPEKNRNLMIAVCSAIQVMLEMEQSRRDLYLREYVKLSEPFKMPPVLDRIIFDLVDSIPHFVTQYKFINRLAKLPDGYYSGFGTLAGHRGWAGTEGKK